MDTRSKPTFVSRGHHLWLALCLLTFLLVYFLVRLLSCLSVYLCLSCLPPHAILAISILLVCFVPFAHYLRISFFPLLVCWFLVLLCWCRHNIQKIFEFYIKQIENSNGGCKMLIMSGNIYCTHNIHILLLHINHYLKSRLSICERGNTHLLCS